MEAAAAVRKARIDALRRLRYAEEAGDSEAIAANEFGRAVKCAYRSSEPPAEVLAAAEASVTRDETIEQGVLHLAAEADARHGWHRRSCLG